MDTLNIHVSKLQFSLINLAGLGGIVLLMSASQEQRPDPLFWVSLLAVLFMFFGSLYRLLNGGPELVLDNRGLTYKYLKVGTIYWSDIIFARAVEGHNIKLVMVWVRNPQDYLQRLSPARRWLMGARKNKPAPPFQIALNGLKISAQQLEEEIRNRAIAAQGGAA